MAEPGPSAIVRLAEDGRPWWQGATRAALESQLPAYVRERRWFGNKARSVVDVHIDDAIGLPDVGEGAALCVLSVHFHEGPPERYLLPLALVEVPPAQGWDAWPAHLVVARVESGGPSRALIDGTAEPGFCTRLLEIVGAGTALNGEQGAAVAGDEPLLARGLFGQLSSLTPTLSMVEQSNTSIIFGTQLILKLYRHLEVGMSPELEIGRFLTERGRFSNTPSVAGWLEYHGSTRETATMAVLQAFVANEGDAWAYTQRAVADFFERADGNDRTLATNPPPSLSAQIDGAGVPAAVRELIGEYVSAASLLGTRTGELHQALIGSPEQAAFAPEPIDDAYRDRLRVTTEQSAVRAFRAARSAPHPAADADELEGLRSALLARVTATLSRPVRGLRIRCHGDYHLGQILWTGEDFFVIDFEGEPARSIEERRAKDSPLRDVAGLLRSFHYATCAPLMHTDRSQTPAPGRSIEAAAWWYGWVSAVFWQAYVAAVDGTGLLPSDATDQEALLDVYLIQKAIYELGYELNNRPEWSRIPLEGLRHLAAG